MITIGLIGTIASGKSEVRRLLSERGARVTDADRLAHEAYAPGSEGFSRLVDAFGRGIVGEDGAIDRRRLGEAVFNDSAQMKRLTAIVWPLARQRAEAIKQEETAKGTEVLVIEAPLLLEAGWRDLVDAVWLVHAPDEVVRERLWGRGHSAEEAEARIAARAAIDPALADTVIENDSDLAALEARVNEAWEKLLRRAR